MVILHGKGHTYSKRDNALIIVFLSLFYLYNEEIYWQKVNKQLLEEYDVLFFQTNILFLTVSK
ncbi:hypothetical protein COD79_30210 [Bacillus cereus]|nr:hypothetical protein CON14_17345 [Bacillus cereus]PEQ73795.1 hypothetical protein CN482_30610 [Bacillus cereus]PEU08267.1 hypothetical protein CN531_21060 [Bacillus cereus]PEX30676.1 hypothetical protein CN459_19585 [Bacillus cereus]PEY11674.1 hypothetical protein CN342_29340 [Bacillus cereus]